MGGFGLQSLRLEPSENVCVVGLRAILRIMFVDKVHLLGIGHVVLQLEEGRRFSLMRHIQFFPSKIIHRLRLLCRFFLLRRKVRSNHRELFVGSSEVSLWYEF